VPRGRGSGPGPAAGCASPSPRSGVTLDRPAPGLPAAPQARIAATCAPPLYQRRQPEGSVLYRTLETHLERFLATTAEDGGPGLPAFVTRELRAYLRCGVLDQGCLHLRCPRCEDETVVAFSCKGRGFYPSCGAGA